MENTSNFTLNSNCTEAPREPVFEFTLKTTASILAVLSNTISIVVFSRMKLKNDVLKYSLVISLADLLYSLIITEISFVQFYGQSASIQRVSKLMNEKFLDEYFTSCIAIFILLVDAYISLQRYFIVTNRHIWIMKWAPFKMSLMFLLVVSLLYYLPSLALFRVEQVCENTFTLGSTEFGKTVFGAVIRIALNTGRILLLICVLPVLNIFIWIQLKKTMDNEKLLNFNALDRQHIADIMLFKNIMLAKKGKERKVNRNMCLMIICISAVNILFGVPYFIRYFYTDLAKNAAFNLWTTVLLNLYHGLNIFIYFLFNKIFREVAKGLISFDILFCYRSKKEIKRDLYVVENGHKSKLVPR